jgi:flagellar biosynthesis protein FlhF
MLVNSKRTGVEARHLGSYEVVVCGEVQETATGDPAYGPQRDPQNSPQQNPQHTKEDVRQDSTHAGSRFPAVPPPFDKLSQDVSELKQRMEKLALTLARSGPGLGSVAFDPELSRAFTALTDAELDTELAYDLVAKLTSPIRPGVLRGELAKLVRVDAELGSPGVPVRVVALVGPPGAGKTSALVKLAVQYGLAARKRVQILTADTYRIAAVDELRSYAAILGIGCQVLETPGALSQAIEEHRQKDLILIDTPGLCRSELEASDDLVKILAAQPGLDIHLVLPASMRAADLHRAAERYSIFHPRKLLFTRLDETETFGPILSRSIRMGAPVSFFSRGQRIPEDLEPASEGLLLDLILGSPAWAEPKFDVVAA